MTKKLDFGKNVCESVGLDWLVDYESEKPCERQLEGRTWVCLNDHTGCLYNDGCNVCCCAGNSLRPLEN